MVRRDIHRKKHTGNAAFVLLVFRDIDTTLERHSAPKLQNIPMLWDVTEPFDAGGFEFGIGLRPALAAVSAGKPLVTVREMSAVRFSFSFSISSRFFPTNVSSLAVSRSRKSAIARCSSEVEGSVKIC